MSDGDRSKRLKVIGRAFLAISVVVGIAIAYGVGVLNGGQSERRHSQPHQHAERAQAYAKRACVGRNPSATTECVYQAIEASQETARAEQDLDAQQSMALWALMMMLVSAVTLIVTSVGVWFVKRTLDATFQAVEDTGKATKAMQEANDIARQNATIADSNRFWDSLQVSTARKQADEANRIARESAERQLRAYVVVDPKGAFMSNDPEINGQVAFEISNTGQTPAYNICISSQVVLSYKSIDDFDPSNESIEYVVENTDSAIGGGLGHHAYHPFTLSEDELTDVKSRLASIMCFGKVTYCDAFSVDRITQFCFYFCGQKLGVGDARFLHRGNSAT